MSKGLGKGQLDILELLSDGEFWSIRKLSVAMNVDYSSVGRSMKRLVKEGLVIKEKVELAPRHEYKLKGNK